MITDSLASHWPELHTDLVANGVDTSQLKNYLKYLIEQDREILKAHPDAMDSIKHLKRLRVNTGARCLLNYLK